MAGMFLRWSSLIIFFLFTTVAHSEYTKNDVCEYLVDIKTGTKANAGTDANIGLTLYDENGQSFDIPDIIKWGGMMGPGHDYFENGNLDSFKGTGSCVAGQVCAMKLVSDNSGHKPGWYVDSVEVTTCRHSRCNRQPFDVSQWLAKDESPYQLYAYRTNCASVIKIWGK